MVNRRGRQSVTKRNTFRWDKRKREAAHLFAENDLSDEEIATRLGTNRMTLWRWRQHPEFAGEVDRVRRELGAVAVRRVIARRNRRLLSLEGRWLAMQEIIEARAADPAHQRAPGGATGLLVRRQKMLGSGENAVLVEEFELDAAILKELREHERQAAIEVGDWVEKRAPVSPDGKRSYEPFTAEQRAAALLRLYAQLDAGDRGQDSGGGGERDRPLLGGPGADPDGLGDAAG
jgi:hypothetical protein